MGETDVNRTQHRINIPAYSPIYAKSDLRIIWVYIMFERSITHLRGFSNYFAEMYFMMTFSASPVEILRLCAL